MTKNKNDKLKNLSLSFFCVDVVIRCKKCDLHIYSYEKVLTETPDISEAAIPTIITPIPTNLSTLDIMLFPIHLSPLKIIIIFSKTTKYEFILHNSSKRGCSNRNTL